MKTYAFYEIMYSEPVVSVYDTSTTEIDIRTQIYNLIDEHNKSHLVIHILDNFVFRSSDKSLFQLGEIVMEKIKLYECERDISNDASICEFYKQLHHQGYLDGVLFPFKYENPWSLPDIIIRAHNLRIVSSKFLIKYLTKYHDPYEYRLEKVSVETC